jgi:hypothetical protein
MAAAYAAALSDGDRGVCGLAEINDSPEEVVEKAKELAHMLRGSRHAVAHTGAGELYVRVLLFSPLSNAT